MLLFAWLGPNLEFGLAFIIPALLNMAAAEQLRRARTR